MLRLPLQWKMSNIRENNQSNLWKGREVVPWKKQQHKRCQEEFLFSSPAPEMLSLRQDLFAGAFSAV